MRKSQSPVGRAMRMLAAVACLPAAVQAAAPPSITQRYLAAEHFRSPAIRRLIDDPAAQARFVDGGDAIVYRADGPDGRGFRLFDPRTARTSAIAADRDLVRLVAARTGETLDAAGFDPTAVRYDPAAGALSFDWHGRWSYARGSLAPRIDAPDPDPGLSPDGRLRIVSRAFNLVVIDVATGREVPLTGDGTADQPYGRGIAPLSDILKQGTDTPDLPVSVRWSPDSRRILTWRLDTRDVPRLSITQANPPHGLYPRSFRYVYPTAGAPRLPTAERFLVDVAAALATGQATPVPVRMPLEELLYPADPDLEWVNGRPRSQWTERGYGKLEVYDIDPATGAARVVAREAVKPLVTVTATALQPAPDLGGELAISERSGWAQLYLVKPDAPDGGRPLTRGAWEVLSIEHVDARGKAVTFTGIGREPGRNPYWRSLYRVGLNGAPPRLLTPEPLDHDVTVSDDGRYAIDRMSSPTDPTHTVVRDLRDGRIVGDLGRADRRALLADGYTMPEPFTGVAADGKTPLYAMIYRPARFDPTRRYPVIDYVYTGPTTTQVPVSWTQAVRSLGSSLSQLGAIVVMIDGRGTSHRGQAFRLPAYQNLGEVGLDDHVAMIRQIAGRYPYLDADRAGVFGCSAGGYDAARFILRRPDAFKVSIAVSGNHDERLDKAWWPEVSMGNPAPDVWDRNSNMAVAGNLKGKLLLVHGDVDDNVPMAETMRLQKALIDAHRDVDVVILPNSGHCDMTPYFWRKADDYLTRNLLGDAPPEGASLDLIGPDTATPPRQGRPS